MAFDEIQKDEIKLRAARAPGDETPVSPESAKAARANGREELDSIRAGNYVLKEELSRGFVGSLHKAVHQQTGSPAVVRILRTPAGGSGGFKKRLKLEIEELRRLSHPSVVPTLEYGETADGLPYVVWEYVDEPTLFDILNAKGNLDRSTVLTYLIGACEALAHAHANNVVHRKLTADKIFIADMTAPGDNVRVGGFGTGWIGDSQKADPRTDVLAFGRIIEEAFAGRSVPPEVQGVIDFCIAEHAVERYSDCREVLQNLLLINQGKLPNPPLSRPGQSLMKPRIVAAVIAVTIALTGFLCFRTAAPDGPLASPAVAPRQPMTGNAEEKIDLRKDAAAHRKPTESQGSNHVSAPPETAQISPSLSTLSREAIKSAAVKSVVAAAKKYKSLTPGQKREVKTAAIKGAAKAARRWQSLTPQTKQAVKTQAANLAGRAARFWRGLPSR
ncbi:MAG TPA: protein kinase [Candidatus Obscuribacterales bacterium]